MKITIPHYINDIMNVLIDNNYTCYLIGGSIRDSLLNKKNKDYDLATNANNETLKLIFKDYELINNNGEKHNTITIHYKKQNIEITSFKHEVGENNTIESDLSHRDFTINAIAYDGNLIDIFNGQDDIKNRIIRAVKNPYDRFKEDPLRILRALRFSSILDFDIEEETSKAMIDLAYLLSNVSNERIKAELVGILKGVRVKEILTKYHHIIFTIIPELSNTYGFNQKNKYHNNTLYDHIINVCENTPSDYIIRMAALLHDIGKLQTFTVDEKGQGHFYKHPLISKEISMVILTRLKHSNDEITKILYLIENHDMSLTISKKAIRKYLFKTPNQDKELFLSLVKLMNSDKMDHTTSRLHDIDEIKLIINEIENEKSCFKVTDLNVDGYDLMKLGYKGKEIGEKLNYLLNSVLDELVVNKKDELITFLNKSK